MNETLAQYSTGQAAEAVHLDQAALDRWLSRSAFELDPIDVPAGGHGHPRKWTARSVRRLAVMVELAKFGVTPSRACRIADAAMAKLHPYTSDVRTYAIVGSLGSVTILNVESARDFEATLDNAIAGDAATLIIDIGRLFCRVNQKLQAAETFIETTND